jgi:hypothetical protein
MRYLICQDLISELKALKDIVFESSGGRMCKDNNWGKSKRTTGRRAISEARQYSQLHYGEDSMRETTTYDAVYGVGTFTFESVLCRIEEIRECFEAEKNEICQEIDRLNDILSGDIGADGDMSMECERGLPKSFSALSVGTSHAVPQDRMETCSVCNARRESSTMTVNNATSKTGGRPGGLVCNVCQVTRSIMEAKISSGPRHSNGVSAATSTLSHSQSTPAHLFASAAGAVKLDTAAAVREGSDHKHNNNADSPGDAPHSARSSRFRSRIDSARHEHHFLEDF